MEDLSIFNVGARNRFLYTHAQKLADAIAGSDACFILGPPEYIENPMAHFMRLDKQGVFDGLSKDEYCDLLEDVQSWSNNFWHDAESISFTDMVSKLVLNYVENGQEDYYRDFEDFFDDAILSLAELFDIATYIKAFEKLQEKEGEE